MCRYFKDSKIKRIKCSRGKFLRPLKLIDVLNTSITHYSGWRSKETRSLKIREWHSSCIRALDFRHRLMGRREVISDTTAVIVKDCI